MHAASERLEFAPPPTPGLLRALILAVLAHALLIAGLKLGVEWRREAPVFSAEAELWSAIPEEAAPRLIEEPTEAPKPAPALTPEPELEVQPTKVDIALEQEKQRIQKQQQLEFEQQQEKIRQDKRKAEQLKADKLKQELAEKIKKDTLEKKKTDLEAKQSEVQRQANLARMTGMAGASGAATATGTSLKSAGPSASYGGRIRARIKPNIVFNPNDVLGNPSAEVEVRTAPDGTIVGRKLLKSSGVKAWDEAVLKAIDKTEVLPRDSDGRVPALLEISFRPKD